MTTTTAPGQILTGAAAIAEGEAREHFRRPRRAANYNERLVEAANILESGLSGSYSALGRLEEAMSTSDFPYYLGDILDRELLPAYKSIDPVWTSFARKTSVRDFRPKKFVDLLGGQEILERVAEGTEYPAGSLDDAEYSLTVGKFGRRLPLSFEAIVNDDLGDFRTLPERLAQAARNTEDYTITGLLATEAGPNSAFFKADNGNAPTALPLTLDNLSTAITTVTSRTVDGAPVVFPSLVLLVPPGLAVQANNIVNALQIEDTQGTKKLTVKNWLASKIRVEENPWLPVLDKSGKANSTWYVLPDPSAARPAVAAGFLRGRETPDLRVKADQGNRVGGGAIGPEEGSFEDDTTQYRVRHILGGTTLDPIGTYVSTGS